MTIQEAIMSGKPFRRKNSTGYPKKRLFFQGPTETTSWLEKWMLADRCDWLDLEHILATDWELKPDPIELKFTWPNVPGDVGLHGKRVRAVVEVIE